MGCPRLYVITCIQTITISGSEFVACEFPSTCTRSGDHIFAKWDGSADSSLHTLGEGKVGNSGSHAHSENLVSTTRTTDVSSAGEQMPVLEQSCQQCWGRG